MGLFSKVLGGRNASVKNDPSNVGINDSKAMKNVPKELAQFDQDGDGDVDRQELQAYIEENKELWDMLSTHCHVSESQCREIARDTAYQMAKLTSLGETAGFQDLQGYDILRDPTIVEFTAFHTKVKNDPEYSLQFFHRTVFCAFDYDNNGYIEEDEIGDFVKLFYDAQSVYSSQVHVALPCRKELTAKILNNFDLNGDGKLDFHELQPLISGGADTLETVLVDDDEEDQDDSNNSDSKRSAKSSSRKKKSKKDGEKSSKKSKKKKSEDKDDTDKSGDDDSQKSGRSRKSRSERERSGRKSLRSSSRSSKRSSSKSVRSSGKGKSRDDEKLRSSGKGKSRDDEKLRSSGKKSRDDEKLRSSGKGKSREDQNFRHSTGGMANRRTELPAWKAREGESFRNSSRMSSDAARHVARASLVGRSRDDDSLRNSTPSTPSRASGRASQRRTTLSSSTRSKLRKSALLIED